MRCKFCIISIEGNDFHEMTSDFALHRMSLYCDGKIFTVKQGKGYFDVYQVNLRTKDETKVFSDFQLPPTAFIDSNNIWFKYSLFDEAPLSYISIDDNLLIQSDINIRGFYSVYDNYLYYFDSMSESEVFLTRVNLSTKKSNKVIKIENYDEFFPPRRNFYKNYLIVQLDENSIAKINLDSLKYKVLNLP